MRHAVDADVAEAGALGSAVAIPVITPSTAAISLSRHDQSPGTWLARNVWHFSMCAMYARPY